MPIGAGATTPAPVLRRRLGNEHPHTITVSRNVLLTVQRSKGHPGVSPLIQRALDQVRQVIASLPANAKERAELQRAYNAALPPGFRKLGDAAPKKRR